MGPCRSQGRPAEELACFTSARLLIFFTHTRHVGPATSGSTAFDLCNRHAALMRGVVQQVLRM